MNCPYDSSSLVGRRLCTAFRLAYYAQLDELPILWHEVALCVRFTVTSRCELSVRLFFVGGSSSLHSVSSGILRTAIFDHSVEKVDKFESSTSAVECSEAEFRSIEASLYHVSHRTTANNRLRIVQQTKERKGFEAWHAIVMR